MNLRPYQHEALEFFAAGMPATKGSAKAFVVDGRAVITNDAGQKAKTWAGLVASAAIGAMGSRLPLEGPIAVHMAFYLPRPKSHYLRHALRSTAPVYRASLPDVDKLLRCALDALTGVVFGDDGQVVRVSAEKPYANDGRCGVRVRVEPLGAAQVAQQALGLQGVR